MSCSKVKFAAKSSSDCIRFKLQLATDSDHSSANAQDVTTKDHWTVSQPATWETPFLQWWWQRESRNTKATQVKQLRLLAELVHLIQILASLNNSKRGLNKWLMVVQVYAIAHIAINLGFHIFILLNSSFLTFSLLQRVNVECVFCVRLVSCLRFIK